MVKKLLLLFSLAFLLQADPLIDKVSSLMDKDSFIKKRKLIEIIFEDKASFYNNEEIDNLKVITKLKDMGLLDLFLNEPAKMYIEFYTEGNPLLSLRVLSESLKSIGYSYFITQKAVNNENGFFWKIYMTTKQAVDPISLANQFEKRGVKLLDISRIDELNWRYDISVLNAKVVTQEVELNSNTKLTKPIAEYWIDVKNANKIYIKPSNLDDWYPKIFFLDSNLNSIQTVIKDEKTEKLTLDIPHNSCYMIIGDKYTLANIKRGLDILLSSY